MDNAGKAAAGAAGRAHSAFSGMLAGLNKTGVLGPFSGALQGVDDAIGAIVDHGKSVGPMMMGVGGAVAGIGAVLSAFGSKEKASHQQLQTAIANTGHSYDEYAGKIESAIKHQEGFGHTADQTNNALQILTQATHDPAKALEYLNTVSDLAAAKHIDLSAAATTVARAYNGNTKVLREFGITAAPNATKATAALSAATKAAVSSHEHLATAQQHLRDVQDALRGKSHLTASEQIRLRDALQKVGAATATSNAADAKLVRAKQTAAAAAHGTQTNIEKLSAELKGQASASADTFSGKLAAFRARAEDAISTFGQRFGPAMQTAGMALMAAGAAMQVFGIESWSALLPILAIIAAVAALVVVGYVIYRNWSTIWNGIKAVIGIVWDWIKSHWPLLLGILFGPIGIAVALIIQNFDKVRAFVGVVVNGIKAGWNALIGFFAGLVSRIGAILGGIFNAASNAAGAVVRTITSAWGGVVGFFAGVVAGVGRVFAGIGNTIAAPFRAAWNAIASGWNNTVGRLSFKVPGWVPLMGGKGFSMPTIPTMQAGGIVTSTGLILAHAGEAVVPLPRASGALGPAVNIEHAHFAETLDVDAFMRRAAWEMGRRAV